jgi:sugar phosphate isomerase/epimerase
MENWPIGVFVRADATLATQLGAVRKSGATTVHLLAPSRALRLPRPAADIREQLAESGILATCVFAGFDGESYIDIPTVRRTVGLVPPATRSARVAELKQIGDFARALGVAAVGVHLGFVPHDAGDPQYVKLIDATRDACDHCAANGQALHLETGQEPADVLLRLAADVGRDNMFVNFDPANMILYGVSEPLAALEKLGPLVRSVHCKDAVWSDRPGEIWGRETPLGEGEVVMEAFLSTLARIGYDGPLTIEREMAVDRQQWMADVARAVALLQRLQWRDKSC